MWFDLLTTERAYISDVKANRYQNRRGGGESLQFPHSAALPSVALASNRISSVL